MAPKVKTRKTANQRREQAETVQQQLTEQGRSAARLRRMAAVSRLRAKLP